MKQRDAFTLTGSDALGSGLSFKHSYIPLPPLVQQPPTGYAVCTLREILNGIFTWGRAHPDRPWGLNGCAIRDATYGTFTPAGLPAGSFTKRHKVATAPPLWAVCTNA